MNIKYKKTLLVALTSFLLTSPQIQANSQTSVNLIVTVKSKAGTIQSCLGLGQNNFVCSTLFLALDTPAELTVTNASAFEALNITATIASGLDITNNTPRPGCAIIAPSASCIIDITAGFTPSGGPVGGNFVQGSNTNPSPFNIVIA